MSTERYEQNFGTCALGDRRLNRRALSIGQALSEKFGQGLSSVFESAKELKRQQFQIQNEVASFQPISDPLRGRI